MSSENLQGLSDWIEASTEARAEAFARSVETTDSLDTQIHAWARRTTDHSAAPGPLQGIPFGAKDIIETRGIGTEYGSPLYRGRIGLEDADIVAELKSRGAVLFGKTQTTAFAYITPSPTRNQHNLNHTPGGS